MIQPLFARGAPAASCRRMPCAPLLGMFSIAFVLVACVGNGTAAPESHPRELIGRWSREAAGRATGDTLDLRPDGSVRGAAGQPVPADARWVVKGESAAPLFCASGPDGSSCQSYQIRGTILTLSGGPTGNTVFARVP